MDESLSVERLTATLNSTTDSRRLTLPPGHRFVMLIGGEKPWIVPITEPGTYDIDAPVILRKTVPFPIRILIVPDNVAATMARSLRLPPHKDIIP